MMVSCDLLESLDFNLMAVGRYWRISSVEMTSSFVLCGVQMRCGYG